jgi:hypothetical protein
MRRKLHNQTRDRTTAIPFRYVNPATGIDVVADMVTYNDPTRIEAPGQAARTAKRKPLSYYVKAAEDRHEIESRLTHRASNNPALLAPLPIPAEPKSAPFRPREIRHDATDYVPTAQKRGKYDND